MIALDRMKRLLLLLALGATVLGASAADRYTFKPTPLPRLSTYPAYTLPRTPTYTTPRTVYVSPTVRTDGTYVAPHFRTAPDRSFNNNWSTYPNVNPYTGKVGTRSPNLFGP